MKRFALLVFAFAAAASAAVRPEDSVVQVFAQQRRPDVHRPWAKGAPHEVSGSGVVIEGNRILTTAHVVEYSSEIQVQANESGDRISGKVLAISYGLDLALLSLEDNTFFASHPPLPRSTALPHIKDAVLVCGFPVGGSTLSTTKGIVSRIEFVPYEDSTSGIRVQLDAAINAGNSGGPALAGGRMIGLAFGRLANAQNIGYITPCEEIQLFLDGVARGGYGGKPALYDKFELLQNDTLRQFLGVRPALHGVVVRHPFSDDPRYPLKEWDVVTRIGNTPIDDQGEIPLTDLVRVRFQYLVQKLAHDGTVPLTVLRRGKLLQLAVPVAYSRPRLVPPLEGKYPSYFIYGPMTFSAATEDFLSLNAPRQIRRMMENLVALTMAEMGNPLVTRRGDMPAFPGEQLVVVSGPFLPSPLVVGYPSPANQVVDTVNGVHVRNLGHLVRLLRDAKGKYVTFTFAGRISTAIVLPRADALAETDDILGDNDIRSQGSPDMMAIWQSGRTPAKLTVNP